MNPKTIIVATKDSKRRVIKKHRSGWPLPPEEGYGSYVDGTGAFKESKKRWEEAGWSVSREPNPHYRPARLFSF